MDFRYKKMIEAGLKVAGSNMCDEDKIWSRYSQDKVDIGEGLARVVRVLNKALSLSVKMRALSIGSSDEPQFRILETFFQGGLYLFDIDKEALDNVRERIRRQHTGHVQTIRGDYTAVFLNHDKTQVFLKDRLESGKVNLATFHHSLYYCQKEAWAQIFERIYTQIIASVGAIHAVLMSSHSDDEGTTTWLYNYFAGKFCGCRNDQDLGRFKRELSRGRIYKDTRLFLRTNRIHFYVHDFTKFMAVIWMILLYPAVHRYTLKQREEITEFIYRRFWMKKKPLIQMQDHLVLYKGIKFRGSI
ncbi:MAG: class I SAM-dependent methyltransferase [Candidatus Omnitrophota bacterium]